MNRFITNLKNTHRIVAWPRIALQTAISELFPNLRSREDNTAAWCGAFFPSWLVNRVPLPITIRETNGLIFAMIIRPFWTLGRIGWRSHYLFPVNIGVRLVWLAGLMKWWKLAFLIFRSLKLEVFEGEERWDIWCSLFRDVSRHLWCWTLWKSTSRRCIVWNYRECNVKKRPVRTITKRKYLFITLFQFWQGMGCYLSQRMNPGRNIYVNGNRWSMNGPVVVA